MCCTQASPQPRNKVCFRIGKVLILSSAEFVKGSKLFPLIWRERHYVSSIVAAVIWDSLHSVPWWEEVYREYRIVLLEDSNVFGILLGMKVFPKLHLYHLFGGGTLCLCADGGIQSTILWFICKMDQYRPNIFSIFSQSQYTVVLDKRNFWVSW